MQQLVNLNGVVVPYSEAMVHVDDRGFTFGDGIYEVVRVYGGRPFEIARHMRRLQRSADALRLRLDPEPAEIERRCRQMVELAFCQLLGLTARQLVSVFRAQSHTSLSMPLMN